MRVGARPSGLAAVVLCAGKGTRMKSEKAKVLHPILGRPLGYYPIARAFELGVSRMVAVVGHQATAVEEALTASFPGRSLQFALQVEQRGTADAVRSAEKALHGHAGPVLILYGDVPLITLEFLRSLVELHQRSRGPLSITRMLLEDPTGYGRVIRERGSAVRIVEEKDCNSRQRKIRECNAGLYIADPDFLWAALWKTKPSNAQGELYLTDLVEEAAKKHKVAVATVPAEEAAGVNSRKDLAGCAAVLQERINAHWMKEGVSLADPRSTFIAEGATLGPDAEVAAMVSILGDSEVGRRVRIGQGSMIVRSRIAEGTEIKPYSLLEDSIVGRDCVIGPFARLRPGTELDEQVHLGNFVETKKTRIGKGSKANHLTYLGDAQIGAGVNVGAGTITCNYDGVHKHQTILEDGVFVGSDTQLVAPVRVGAGAYIGAGTTVTQDVPPRSLALSRAPQTIKEGWVPPKKRV